ncbi:SCP2 sterol-binding domain-containing protein [Haloarcula onubensis]|uniref:SCP2 sterol-binding domain-containing protein n=1 Tax=Haloarcula onubensis TaxID=2950539 RepID=A0ABU2FM82_9EURY|nr:SCP2 sterol-binding domain-containing protein [Halomicroarcula sp. S3CR25-11]MDS0281868.1 SCP2 sterol-binding domain-containing protein [Halomicroarcula sp. S3CR25-11]
MTLTLPADAAAWAATWRDRINDREDFAAAAADFEATFLFEIQADDRYDGEPVRFRVTLADGACTETALVDGGADYDFALRGPYDAWAALLAGDLDVSESVMDGTFDVTGNTMTLLRRQDAVSEMVAAAQSIDTEFEH